MDYSTATEDTLQYYLGGIRRMPTQMPSQLAVGINMGYFSNLDGSLNKSAIEEFLARYGPQQIQEDPMLKYLQDLL